MPVEQHTTSTPHPTTAESSSSQELVQQAFHDHLRKQIRGAVRIVLEEIMREELTQFLGAGYGEVSPERKGYRNGSYTRDLATSSGRIEDLQVPRDREGQFHTQLFERYSRYEHEPSRWINGDVCQWDEHPQSRGSSGNSDGSGPQRKSRESPQ